MPSRLSPLYLALDLRTSFPSQPNSQVDRNYDHILSPAPKISVRRKAIKHGCQSQLPLSAHTLPPSSFSVTGGGGLER